MTDETTTTDLPPDEARAPMRAFSLADAQPIDENGAQPTTRLRFATVAIGASAGGVEAALRLFRGMPVDSGCAFVLVIHLDPSRESMMASLLGRATSMPVEQARDGVLLQANHVYTNVPGMDLGIQDGRLELIPAPVRPPKAKAVDRFMLALALDQRDRSIGIVLSGTDGDGALGIKAIKAEGGLTIAQLPETAAHAGMPQSAIDTGMVDLHLRIEAIPQALADYVAHARLGPADLAGDESGDEAAALEQTLAQILVEVKVRADIDFRGYKPAMLRRRVQRRMGLARASDLHAYLAYLRSTPAEAGALASDFLIGVTEFFREPEAWEALIDDILPKLLAGKSDGDTLRAWVPACATGEEAYSLAMVLLEHPRTQQLRLKVQDYATDHDRSALAVARAGRYPDSIDAAVTQERRARFFSRVDNHYLVRPQLREAVLFAPHNLIADTPFSHMDLVSCRNLLIYLEPEMQRHVLQEFHFALEAERYLFLGRSETVGSETASFALASPRARIYRRIGAARLRADPSFVAGPRRRRDFSRSASTLLPREPDYARLIAETLLESSSVAGILTNRQGEALYFYGPVHPFVEPPVGAPNNDIFSMLRDECRPHLRALVHKAVAERQRASATIGMAGADGAMQAVRLAAAPLPAGGDADLLLVSFEPLPTMPLAAGRLADAPTALRALEDELRRTQGELRGVIRELELANEELRVANEEAMSSNEELQSSNEELETSKEELQSVNEELVTVNAQLQEKLGELEATNNDLGNLFSSTDTPTLFLDRELRLKRFVPSAARLFRLLPGDVDRPISDIASRVDMGALREDAQRVLADLQPRQNETRSDDGGCHLRRTQPYRTREGAVDGVVVTFTDISELKEATAEVRRLAAVVQSSSDAIIVQDPHGKVLAWNRGAQKLYGYTEAEVIEQPIDALLVPEDRAVYEVQVKGVLAGEPVESVTMQRRTRDGRLIQVSTSLSLLRDPDGQPSALALIERGVTERLAAEAALRMSEQRFHLLADSAPVLIWLADAQDRLVFANRECSVATGQDAQRLVGRRWTELLHPDDVPGVLAAVNRSRREGGGRIDATARLLAPEQGTRWVKTVALPRTEAGSDANAGLVGCMFDIDAQVRAEAALHQESERKDEFLAMLGHELRNPLVPIRNAAEVLGMVGGSEPRIAWVRETLVRQVDHVTRLVDDLLDISRVTRGSMSLNLVPLALGAVIRRAVESVEPLFERKRHVFELDLPPDEIWVEGDAIRLAQVVENLLTNAAKYTDAGGRISLRLELQGAHALIHVRDNGIGISPRMQGRMFDLFVQDERSIDRSQGGLGIGLALVRYLVELHHGRIVAESAGSGEGSDFIVSLPVLRTAEAIGEAQRGLAPASGGQGGRVLLVDDDIDASESFAILLSLHGFEVQVANDAVNALRIAESFAPQVAILDLAMPQADGYELAQRLRALPALAGTRYVALSGFGGSANVERSRRAGFAHHFVKPADPAEMRAKLAELMAAKAAPELSAAQSAPEPKPQ